MHVSIIIPTYRGAQFIPYALKSLGRQSFDDFEVIVVIKSSGDGTEGKVREICGGSNLEYRILIQKEGYFTRALNMGIQHAKGEIILCTDDDAFFPKGWVESHIATHTKFKDSGAVSGHDIPYHGAMSSPQASFTFKRQITSGMRRGWRVVKPVFNKPHPLFKKYKLGIYITKRFKVTSGFGIPSKLCLSLPVLGVNMSFKKDAIEGLLFPEHPLLRIAPNNEQYFAAQLVLRGWKSIYNPHIQVHHIVRTGLSKSPQNVMERQLVRWMLAKLFERYK